MTDGDVKDEGRSELERLAEEYVRLYRAGKEPDLEQFVLEHPALADEIRELFPVMLMLDGGRSSNPEATRFATNINSSFEEAIGAQLGDYTLIKIIGRGGMGVVYEAKHITLGNRVAVKLLPSSLNRPKLQERFLREASAAARMNHPNIVRVFDYGREGNHHYYVMSLVEGVGLDRVLEPADDSPEPGDQSTQLLVGTYQDLTEDRFGRAENRRQTPPSKAARAERWSSVISAQSEAPSTSAGDSTITAKRNSTLAGAGSSNPFSIVHSSSLWSWIAKIGVQAAEALAYAHDMGVLHRDIKPSNLMLDVDGNLFVTDFGLAKLAGDPSLTETGDILGTLRYLPPEAIYGQPDERGDIYGLGLTLYELAAGKPAFGNLERGKLFHDIAQGHIKPLRKLIPRIPRDLAQIIAKSLRLDVEQRYTSAAEMSADLRHFIAGEPVIARPPSLTYRTSRWIARNRVVSVLGIGLVLVLVTATMLSALSVYRYKNLVVEKDFAKTNAEIAQRLAQTTSLEALISDAEGWAIRHQVGQRRIGLQTLRQAMDLSHDLACFEQYEFRFNEIAAMLFALDDIDTTYDWQQGVNMGFEEPLAFSGDLQSYFWHERDTEANSLRIYDRQAKGYELAQTVPIRAPVSERNLQASANGRFLAGSFTDGKFFVFDRLTLDCHEPELLVSAPAFAECLFNDDKTLSILTEDSKIVTLQLPNCEVVHEIGLPGEFDLDSITFSSQGDRAFVFQRFRMGDAYVVDLSTDAIEHQQSVHAISAASFSPDGRYLAFVSDVSLDVWDNVLREFAFETNCSHEWTTRVEWLAGGKYLATTGFDGQTRIFDPRARREILRIERVLAATSIAGDRFVLRANDRFQLLTIRPAEALHTFSFYRGGRFFGGIIGGNHLIAGFIEGFRIWDLQCDDTIASQVIELRGLAIDPQNRDVFLASSSEGLVQLPIVQPTHDSLTRPERELQRGLDSVAAPDNSNVSSPWTIGPARSLNFVAGQDKTLERSSESVWGASFNSAGEKLSVTLSQEFEWSDPRQAIVDRQTWSGVHFKSDHPIFNFQSSTLNELAVTRSKITPGIHVIDTATGETLFAKRLSPCWSELSSDGKQLILSHDSRIEIYDTATWKVVAISSPELIFDSGEEFSISTCDRWLAIEAISPRGVLILDRRTLEPALRLIGAPGDPASDVLPQGFDSTGQWLVAKRGASRIACWNLAALRTEFESIDLRWPLDTLGQGSPKISARKIFFQTAETREEKSVPLTKFERE